MVRRCVGLLIFWVLLMAGPVRAEEPVADDAPEAAVADKLALLRQRVRHVFIIFQENRSFDHLFGSFPGARGLYSQPPAETPGYEQTLTDPTGRKVTVGRSASGRSSTPGTRTMWTTPSRSMRRS